MKSVEIDWRGGRVCCWRLDEAMDAKGAPIPEALTEDLAQIQYPSTLIDVGWYPSGSARARFVVVVIAGRNWDAPVLRRQARGRVGLKRALRECVLVACATAGRE